MRENDAGRDRRAAPATVLQDQGCLYGAGRDWPLPRSLAALDLVKDCLAAVRQTDAPVNALTRQCLFDIARSGRA